VTNTSLTRFVRHTNSETARSEDVQLRPFSNFNHHTCVVLLGDPGAGKTHLFRDAANTEKALFIRARSFLSTPAKWLTGQVHFIDGLDEKRGGRGERDTIDRMVEKLFEAILGVESYIPAAVKYELTGRSLLSDEARRAPENPFALGGGTAQAFFDKLPAFVDASITLSRYDGALFERFRLIYKCLRNLLFHGSEIAFAGDNYDAIVIAFEMFAEVYDWIDSWYGAFSPGWRDRRVAVGSC